MGELPSARIQASRPFLYTGVHYAGPISLRVRTPRSKTIFKGYIALFVCFDTKTIHIEIVTSLTTEAFLAALSRFIARRGRSKSFILTIVPTSKLPQISTCSLQDAAVLIADGNHPRLPGGRRMRVESHPSTRPTFRKIMWCCSQINEITPTENTRFSCCHLWRTSHYVVRDRTLSKFQTPMCLIRRPFQCYLFVPWILSYWWTTHPITSYWLN